MRWLGKGLSPKVKKWKDGNIWKPWQRSDVSLLWSRQWDRNWASLLQESPLSCLACTRKGVITALMTWYLGTVPVVTYFSDSSLSEKPEGSGFSLRTNNTQHRYAKILVPVISKPSKSFFCCSQRSAVSCRTDRVRNLFVDQAAWEGIGSGTPQVFRGEINGRWRILNAEHIAKTSFRTYVYLRIIWHIISYHIYRSVMDGLNPKLEHSSKFYCT